MAIFKAYDEREHCLTLIPTGGGGFDINIQDKSKENGEDISIVLDDQDVKHLLSFIRCEVDIQCSNNNP